MWAGSMHWLVCPCLPGRELQMQPGDACLAMCWACPHLSCQALLSHASLPPQINAKSARMVEGRQQILRVS